MAAVGTDVTRFQPGDEVFGIGEGAFAEYARASESKLARRPANLTAEQAAAVAVSALTALQGLRDHGRVQPGQQVLITGASGGVGTFAVRPVLRPAQGNAEGIRRTIAVLRRFRRSRRVA